MKKRIIVSLIAIILVTMACALPFLGSQGNNTQTDENLPTETLEPPSQPVSLTEGLASLDSYHAVLTMKITGPDPATSSSIDYDILASNQADASYTIFNIEETSSGEDTSPPVNSEMYSIGNDICTNYTDVVNSMAGDEYSSGGDGTGEDITPEELWDWQSMDPNQAEMTNLFYSVFSFSPVYDNPTFVAQETVNGIETNHFTFKISGLGSDSGANVTINKGDYWVAVDGQYLVKYDLTTETVVDPETNVMHVEILYELKEVNQPVDISFPQGCLDAKAASLFTFEGDWTTDLGDMTCTEDYGYITCNFANEDAVLEGYMDTDGVTLIGNWYPAPASLGAEDGSSVTLTLSEDASSFTGEWYFGDDTVGGQLNGTRQ